MLMMTILLVYFYENIFSSYDENIFMLFLLRFVSTFMEIPIRVYNHLLEPFTHVWNMFAFAPAGTGIFSPGSQYYNGKLFHEVITIGTAESSWLALLAEEGIVGFVGGMVFWGGIFSYFFYLNYNNFFNKGKKTLEADSLIICALILVSSILLWANTHNVLGNVTVMSISMFIFGVGIYRK